jgi:hypothetical protein
MLRLIIGAVLGAIGMYAYTSSPAGRKNLKALGTGTRLPKPATMVDLPMDTEDLLITDQVICHCAKQIIEATPEMLEAPEPLVATLQVCSARALYGEIPWPPVAGDHPTIHQLWGILGFRARGLILQGNLKEFCATQGMPSGPGLSPLPPAPPEEQGEYQLHAAPIGP